MRIDRSQDGSRLRGRTEASQAKQKHAGGHFALPEDKFPEVLVERDENCATIVRPPENGSIIDSWFELGDVFNAMVGRSDRINDRAIDPFVAEEGQAASSGTGYTTSARSASAAKARAAWIASRVSRGLASMI